MFSSWSSWRSRCCGCGGGCACFVTSRRGRSLGGSAGGPEIRSKTRSRSASPAIGGGGGVQQKYTGCEKGVKTKRFVGKHQEKYGKKEEIKTEEKTEETAKEMGEA